MNLTETEARELTTAISDKKIPKDITVILGCPSPYLSLTQTLTNSNKNVHISAQNAHQEAKGAFTGEISHRMLSSLGVNYVIIGHSERREYFKESNKLLKKKVDVLIENDFQVIFCCGEPLKVRKSQKHKTYVEKQLKESLFHLSSSQLKNVIIAYEPIWAIGTGVTASPAQAQDMHKFIRSLIKKNYSQKTASELSILYGGSVKPANAKQLFGKTDVDGGLVGGASLNAKSFKAILNALG